MKKSTMVKLVAGVSAFAMLLSQMTALAKFNLTAEKVIDGTAWGSDLLRGFAMDSKDYAGYERYDTYGRYDNTYNWDQLTNNGWNAEDSMNIYPIGEAGSTNYAAINNKASFENEKYDDYMGTDVEIWNGYMFVVLQKVDWAETGGFANGRLATFDSIIQVYDIANGGKEHVATWTAADLGLTAADLALTEELAQDLTYGIHEITVTDDHIFMLLDISSPNWLYWNNSDKDGGVNTFGCGLAVFDNNIDSVSRNCSLPTRSKIQPERDEETEETDSLRYGVDIQSQLVARGSADGWSKFIAIGDYLLYLPYVHASVFGCPSLKRGNGIFTNNDGSTYTDIMAQGVHVAKWNDSARASDEPIQFAHYTLWDWLGLENYFDSSKEYYGYQVGVEGPAVAGTVIQDNYLYLDVVYTLQEDGIENQYEQIFIADIADVLNPKVVGHTAPMLNPSKNELGNIMTSERVMSVGEDGFVYIAQKHWYAAANETMLNDPYVFIYDARDKTAPKLATSFRQLEYFGDGYPYGADAITSIGDYVIIPIDVKVTVFLKMNEERTAVVDHCQVYNCQVWGAITNRGSAQPLIYGNRIFYPTLNGNSPGFSSFQYTNRIEVINFENAQPRGIYIKNITANADGSYTISGTTRGIKYNAGYRDYEAITIKDTDTKSDIDYIYFGDMDRNVESENDVLGWSYQTEPNPTVKKLTFQMNSGIGAPISGIYEEVNLDLIGVESVFTLTAAYSTETVTPGDLTVTPSVSNMTAAPVSGVIVVAVYNDAGKMVNMEVGASETIGSTEEKGLTPVTVTVPQDGTQVKTFMFNSLQNIQPVCPNLTF